jgi:glycosyltransferase involved in cell wall biosynthesis
VEPESLSLVIPTFREDTFGQSLDYLLEYLTAIRRREIEIMVVDDSDAELQAKMEAEIAQRRERVPPWVRIEFVPGPRRGKGAAIRLGARRARGDVVVLLDADMPVPLANVERFLDTMRMTGADIVVAERQRDRHHDRTRSVLSWGLRLIQTTLVFHKVVFDDTQCGFKAFRAGALRDIVDYQTVERGMYDLEYLYVASLWRLNVQRMQVESREETRSSRIDVWRCLMHDPIDIVKFKVLGILGYYR